jgi:ABC-2 type transport system ATP-binding protein
VLLDSGRVLAVDTPGNVRNGVAGRVFEVAGPDTIRLAADLAREQGPRAIQVLPDRVRFQMPVSVPVADLRLPTIKGELRAAAPMLDDVFVQNAVQAAPAELPVVAAADGSAEVPGVVAEALTVEFGAFRAVDRVSLTVDRGRMLALLGPNGAGKTTLIRALCGLVRVARGSGAVAGLRVGEDVQRLRQRIGYMSQRFSLYVDLTAAENLWFFASAYGLGRSQAQTRVDWACGHTGVDPGEPRFVANLSGAERQRLALACAILHRPAVLFLDEPTSGIDPAARYRFWWLIRSLAAGGMTIVVSTHYLDEAAYCDRIALMDRGRLVAHGSLRELRETFAGGREGDVEAIFVAALEHARAELWAA